jgi:hypothetical protein
MSETNSVPKALLSMLMVKRNLRVVLGFFVLMSLAVAVGCHGFFVNPTLTTITITPPTPTITVNNTVQMTATGTYNDGSIKTLGSEVTWTTSAPSSATIRAGGLVTGVASGSATITASSGIAVGTTTVTVSPANLTSIQITPQSTSVKTGNSVAFIATGFVAGGGTVDVSQSATWSSTATGGTITFSNGSGSDCSTIPGVSVCELANAQGFSASQNVTISATVTSTNGNVVGTATLVVTP